MPLTSCLCRWTVMCVSELSSQTQGGFTGRAIPSVLHDTTFMLGMIQLIWWRQEREGSINVVWWYGGVSYMKIWEALLLLLSGWTMIANDPKHIKQIEKMFLSDSLKNCLSSSPPIDFGSLNQCIPLVPTISSKGYLLCLLYIPITSPCGVGWQVFIKIKTHFIWQSEMVHLEGLRMYCKNWIAVFQDGVQDNIMWCTMRISSKCYHTF